MKSKLLKGGLTVVGAVLLSTLGIFASDHLQGIDRDLLGLSGASTKGICPSGAVPLKSSDHIVCVDMYEASPSTECPKSDPKSVLESEENASASGCHALSAPDVLPWRYVSLPQAQRMCANAGKRLPTADEWYKIAVGTDPEKCIINTDTPTKSASSACVSPLGAYDLVGNVWEWVDETVADSSFDGRALPGEGYVTSIDASGIAITVSEDPDELYGADYFWSKPEGVFGMIRGGFYGSRSDAGLYTTNASVQTSFASQGVGFRCVEDIF